MTTPGLMLLLVVFICLTLAFLAMVHESKDPD